MTIARSWSARATRDGLAPYLGYVRAVLAPALARLDGYLGASILERAVGDLVEITVVTRWTSLDAVRGFAGDDLERAVVEPEARALLVAFDDRVEHRSVVLELAP
jgi:heme-degrading monooxygenase HmoA